jgi:hypothetical protein
VLAHLTTRSIQNSARVVAMLAPPEAAAEYVHTCMRGERALERWNIGLSLGGGLVPFVFLYAGRWVGMSAAIVLCAQLAWMVLWTYAGVGWQMVTIANQTLELTAGALTVMAERTDPPPTQERLNEATRRLGLDGYWSDRPPS